MNFPTTATVSIVALLPVATANLDIYAGTDAFSWDQAYNVWQIFEAEPDCNQIRYDEIFQE